MPDLTGRVIGREASGVLDEAGGDLGMMTARGGVEPAVAGRRLDAAADVGIAVGSSTVAAAAAEVQLEDNSLTSRTAFQPVRQHPVAASRLAALVSSRPRHLHRQPNRTRYDPSVGLAVAVVTKMRPRRTGQSTGLGHTLGRPWTCQRCSRRRWIVCRASWQSLNPFASGRQPRRNGAEGDSRDDGGVRKDV